MIYALVSKLLKLHASFFEFLKSECFVTCHNSRTVWTFIEYHCFIWIVILMLPMAVPWRRQLMKIHSKVSIRPYCFTYAVWFSYNMAYCKFIHQQCCRSSMVFLIGNRSWNDVPFLFHQLHSGGQSLLVQPFVRSSGARVGFSYAAPLVWNNLGKQCSSCDSALGFH